MSEKYQAPTPRRYSPEFKERAVRMVRQLRAGPVARDSPIAREKEIASVIWSDDGDKLYLYTLGMSLREPTSGYIPESEVSEVTIIHLHRFAPKTPQFDLVRDIQKGDLLIHGGDR